MHGFAFNSTGLCTNCQSVDTTDRPLFGLETEFMLRWITLAVGAGVFCLLVLLNVGGYRYGVSDQAFYIPVVQQGLEPTLFPHDTPLLDAQNQLFAFDDLFALVIRMTGTSLPVAFFVAYLAGLTILYGASVSIGRSLFSTWWGVSTFALALTIRHRIPDTAVNTLEAYLHPRQLALAVGLVAVSVFLRGHTWLAVAAVAGALLLHPTTAIWFAILLGIAILVSDRESRQPILALAGGIGAAATVLLASTLREQVALMDPTWMSLLQSKDYLHATDWPMLTWFANLGFAAIIAAIYDYRRALAITTPRETGLVWGCASLLLLFLISVPLAHAGVALVIQLQFSRIFWLLDILAIAYMTWLLVESPIGQRAIPKQTRVRYAVVVMVFALTLARGSYVTYVEKADRPLIEIDLPENEWTEVMDWAGKRPVGTHFLVDPGHAWRYGSSVRAASGRDVYLEEIKDIGIAIYSSQIAERVSTRIAELGNFSELDSNRARRLAHRYHLDYLITEHPIGLPLVHQQGPFNVYDLRADSRLALSFNND